jgi:hypothetical protein
MFNSPTLTSTHAGGIATALSLKFDQCLRVRRSYFIRRGHIHFYFTHYSLLFHYRSAGGPAISPQ